MILETLRIIFTIIISLLLLITVHEFGHFIVAKFMGIKVLRFSIGFGKPLFSWRSASSGTEYVITVFPLGGYVKMLDEREGKVLPQDVSLAFNRQAFWKRFCVILGGPVANVLLAWLLFWSVFSIGMIVPLPIIGTVIPDSPAALANIRADSQIVAIDDRATPHWTAVVMAMVSRMGETTETMTMTTRDRATGQTQQHEINLSRWNVDPLKPQPLNSLGIQPKTTELELQTQQYPFIKASFVGLQEVWAFAAFNSVIIYKMFSGDISIKSLGGPLTLFQSIVLAAEQGVVAFLAFFAVVSVMLAVINLVPFPGLDGGHVAYLLIEAVIRRPVSVAVQVLLFRLGMIAIIVLLVQALSNDLLRLV